MPSLALVTIVLVVKVAAVVVVVVMGSLHALEEDATVLLVECHDHSFPRPGASRKRGAGGAT